MFCEKAKFVWLTPEEDKKNPNQNQTKTKRGDLDM